MVFGIGRTRNRRRRFIFTEIEKNSAKKTTLIINNFHGNISKSQFQQNSNDSIQKLSFGYSKETIESILKELKDNYKEIALSEEEPELEEYMSKLEETISLNPKNNSKIKSILNSIIQILEVLQET